MRCRIERTLAAARAWSALAPDAEVARIDPRRVEDALGWAHDDGAHEVDVDLSHARLAAFAITRGYAPGPIGHVYTLARADADALRPSTGVALARRATPADLAFIQELHESEFPATYASTRTLVTDPTLFTLLIERDRGPLGYAAGHVCASGAATLDVMAVAPLARGVGDGSRLLAAAVAELFTQSGADAVQLMVEEHRAPAIAFYEGHGFVRATSHRTFRRMTAPTT